MSEPFRRFLSKLSAHGSMLTMQRGGKAAVAHCPAHEDNKQSLSVKLSDSDKVLVHCFAGCETEDILAKLGMEMADLFGAPAPQQQAQEVKIVATYDYRDEKGELLNQVVRLEPKSFRQRRPDGQGGWIWSLGDVRRVLYRLPEMNRDRKQPLWIVEGEKDVDALRDLGFRATTCIMGAGKWQPEYTEQIKRSHVQGVYVAPDNDMPGRRHAHAIATSIHAAGIPVKIVNLPGVVDKGDVSDYLKTAQFPAGDLRRLAQTAPLFTGQEAPPSLDPMMPSPRRAARVRSPRELSDKPIEYLINGLIPAGWFGELAGRDGRGKTLLGMNIAKSVLTGAPLFDTFEVGKRGPVVMYLLDDPENLVRERLNQLGMLDLPGLYVGTQADLDLSDPDLFADLADLCEEVNPALVMIDALYLFTPATKGSSGDQANSSGAMMPIVQAFDRICTQTGATVALVAHDNKAGTDVAGSQAVRNMAKWILRMALPKQYEKDKQGGRTTNDRILELDKLKTGQSQVWGMTITTGDHGGAEFSIVPLDSVEKKSKSGRTVEEMNERRQHVVDWLRFLLEPGARTATEVYEAALEAKIKKREVADKGVAELAGVEKVHLDPPGGPWVWKLKS